MGPLAAFVAGKALERQFAPAERIAHWPGRDDRRLSAVQRQGDVGAREQAAAPAQAGFRPVEAKAVIEQRRPDDPGREPRSESIASIRQ